MNTLSGPGYIVKSDVLTPDELIATAKMVDERIVAHIEEHNGLYSNDDVEALRAGWSAGVWQKLSETQPVTLELLERA